MTAMPEVADGRIGLADWMAGQGARVEAALEDVLAFRTSGEGAQSVPPTLAEAMRYAVLGGGNGAVGFTSTSRMAVHSMLQI